MSENGQVRQPNEKAWAEYVSQLARKYSYAGTVEEARAAVDRCMGDRPLTDLLYEQRKERSL